MLNNATSGSSGGDFSLEDNEEAKKERMKYLSETYWEKLGNTISDKTYNHSAPFPRSRCRSPGPGS